MSYYVVRPPRRTPLAVTALVGGVLLLVAVALLSGWLASQPVTAVVDGTVHRLPHGTLVGDLQRSDLLSSPPGRLIAVDGSVVETVGGEPPPVLRNGEAAPASQRLFTGDVVVSSAGADVRESLVVTEVAVPFVTRYEGDGPLIDLKTLGAPGLRRVTRGAVSGIEVTSTVLLQPTDMVIARSRPKGKVVALTFDDGPWPKHTDRVLKILKKEKVKATFFMLGTQADRHPDIAKRVAEQGHGIGNHTHSHRVLASLSGKKARSEIRKGRNVLKRVTGQDTAWLRPPYGSMDRKAWQAARKMNSRVLLWDVDSRDWTRPGARRIAKTVVRDVRPGSVVLFHDGGGNRKQTIKALPKVIKKLKKKGYTFVTVDELAELRVQRAAEKKAAREAAAAKKVRSGSKDSKS